MTTSELGVWAWDGFPVATLTRGDAGPATVRLTYTDEALDRWPANAPVLSCSLPLSSRTVDATAFLRGVLPEGQHLNSLAAEADVGVSDTFGLCERLVG